MVRAAIAASSGNGEASCRAKWCTRTYAPETPTSSAATASSMVCRSASCPVRTWDPGDVLPVAEGQESDLLHVDASVSSVRGYSRRARQDGRMPLPRCLRPAVAWFSRTRLFRAVGPTIMPPLERLMTRLTQGRVQLSGLLRAVAGAAHDRREVGASPATSTLMYCPDGDDMLVTGSNFARDTHPAWTANLLRHPDAAVTVARRRIERARRPWSPTPSARRSGGSSKQNWPGYRGYERTAGSGAADLPAHAALGRLVRRVRRERRRRAAPRRAPGARAPAACCPSAGRRRRRTPR